jgi:polyhydroxyalkanoate synthesis regulator phasin
METVMTKIVEISHKLIVPALLTCMATFSFASSSYASPNDKKEKLVKEIREDIKDLKSHSMELVRETLNETKIELETAQQIITEMMTETKIGIKELKLGLEEEGLNQKNIQAILKDVKTAHKSAMNDLKNAQIEIKEALQSLDNNN